MSRRGGGEPEQGRRRGGGVDPREGRPRRREAGGGRGQGTAGAAAGILPRRGAIHSWFTLSLGYKYTQFLL